MPSLKTPFGSFAALCRMVKIEHSVFALPFAFCGAFLAAGGIPPLDKLVWLTLAMIAVRSFAMGFNRVADLPFDRLNPRTRQRPLVTGEITLFQAWAFCACMALIFIGACACMNQLCLILAVPALVFCAAYSLLKRVTWLCHFWLGATLGLAPLAGWLCVTPILHMTPVLLFFGITFWTGSFDILYSCQDVEFDREQNLHSIPARFGIPTSLTLAAFSHVITAIFFLLAGWSAGLSLWWYVIWAGVALLLFWEHHIVSPEDMSRVNMAFFTLNGAVSAVVLGGVLLGLFC